MVYLRGVLLEMIATYPATARIHILVTFQTVAKVPESCVSECSAPAHD
jgi:hypothetical protein